MVFYTFLTPHGRKTDKNPLCRMDMAKGIRFFIKATTSETRYDSSLGLIAFGPRSRAEQQKDRENFQPADEHHEG